MVLVKDHYHQGIYDIMRKRKIRASKRCHNIAANAGLAEVVQYTEWHVGYKSREQEFRGRYTNRHYRYERYQPVMNRRGPSDRRQVHIDVGCGAGVFSWAFLDWATSRNIGYDRIELYGLDRSKAMLDLARMLKNEMSHNIPNYPDLHYYSDIDDLLYDLNLQEGHDKDYTITFGHVLVQAHGPEDIEGFARIISNVVDLTGPESKCVLAAVDALNQAGEFSIGWNALMDNVKSFGVKIGHAASPSTSTRLVRLYPPVR